MNVTTLSNWVSGAAVLGAGVIYLILAPHVNGVAGRLDQVRGNLSPR
jgi:hypothetical protein